MVPVDTKLLECQTIVCLRERERERYTPDDDQREDVAVLKVGGVRKGMLLPVCV